MAADRGWAEPDKGIAGIADLLIKGRSGTSASVPAYAEDIGADARAPALVLARISSDGEAARTGLEDVTLEARAVLDNRDPQSSHRNDVIAYERALVRAQMAYRNFHQALEIVSTRADMDVAPVRQELDAFADSIDEARRVADKLAELYAGSYGAAS